MCGIAGYVNFANHRRLAAEANRIQHHRGPDAEGVWGNHWLSLAHQRLSIIDLDPRSNQPLESGGMIIVFNGEIYNYRALRDRLERDRGVVFRTESDTEVLLEMYRNYGTSGFRDLIGMIAFAIYDENSERLTVVRDHFGIKPLFYYADANRFAFSSELKTLARTVPVDASLRPEGLAASLLLLWLPEQICAIHPFLKLPPGHYVEVGHQGDVRMHRYWSLPDHAALDLPEDELVDALACELEASLHRHLVADVEVAAFLSGGLDSSLICAMAKKKIGRLRTFTIGTTSEAKQVEQMPDDELYARELAAAQGFHHDTITIKPNLVADLPGIVEALDEPIGDPAALNTSLICRAAKQQGIKVLLSGMGSDEIFFGYRRHKAWMMAARYKSYPQALRSIIRSAVDALPVRAAGRGFRFARWSKKFLSFAERPPEEAYRMSYSYYDVHELQELLNAPWRDGIGSVPDLHQRVFWERFADDPINQLCYTDMNLFMAGLNLTYTDRASMLQSTEVRVPFIDKTLVEFSMRIPGKMKYRRGQTKYILKKVAERYLPREIIYRPKASFGAPIRKWIADDLREMVDDLLSVERVRSRGWFDSRRVRMLVEQDRSGKADNAYRIYQLLTLELWAQQYLDPPRPALP